MGLIKFKKCDWCGFEDRIIQDADDRVVVCRFMVPDDLQCKSGTLGDDDIIDLCKTCRLALYNAGKNIQKDRTATTTKPNSVEGDL